MYFNRKLKSPELKLEHFTGFGVLILFLLVAAIFGFRYGFIVMALFGLVMATLMFLVVLKTKNLSYLALTTLFVCITLLSVSLVVLGIYPRTDLKILLSLLIIYSSGVVLFLVITRNLKWKTREILELAAMPVEDISEGFTQRPKPIGKTEHSKMLIESFGRFIMKKLIAMVYFEPDKTVISLDNSLIKQMGIRNDYSENTTITFHHNGEVNVFLSQEDYNKYRDTFSYDQLCQSLGNLFIGFMYLFNKGEGKQIIDRCNKLGLNIFIE